MINPKLRIYKSFVAALQGITHNSNPVPVYSYPALGAGELYILVGNITTVEEGCKQLFGHECTIDIQVISNYTGNYGTPLDGEEVADQVTQKLKTFSLSTLPIDEFNMVYILLDNGFNDGGLFDTDRTYRTINQYRFYIEETSEPCEWILANGVWNDSGCWNDAAVWID